MSGTAIKRALVAGLSVVLATAGVALATAPTASAVGSGTQQPTLVATAPSRATPNITDGIVYAITKVGSQIIVGGSFTTVQNPGSSTAISRPYLLAFDATTGTVSTSFAPVLDGTVEAVQPGPSPNTVYVGGYFKTANGAKSKSVTLLDTTTGAIVGGFKPPALNGAVWSLATVPGHLLVTGSFTTANSLARGGLVSLNPTTGALDSYLSVQLAGHHNYTGGGGAQGPVGGRAMAVSPDNTRLVVLGNFKTADGRPRDQMVMIDLGSSSAGVDPNWKTLKYTAACASSAFDTYVTDVQWASDGSYFVTVATGGGGPNSLNTDGSRSLCDAAARWSAADTGSNVSPVWVDYTGNDTLWSVAISGTAIYVGGHQRWMNNYSGNDSAGQGAVPRPGLAALDPASGAPLKWNPGRNPRGKGAYALYLSDNGLYVGSDTDWFGNFAYKRQKIGFFPLAGGVAPASTSVATLPANVYLGGPSTGGRRPSYTDDLDYRPMSQTQVGATTTLPPGSLAWSTVRGAFVVGNTLFYGTTLNRFYQASFDGSAVGASSAVDPYNDPAWCSVQTGSGQTYCGVGVNYYGQLSSVSGAFYQNGRLYYTLQSQGTLYWRWFSPDSGIVGSQQFSVAANPLSNAAGLFASGNTLYYANKNDGSLHAMDFSGGVPNPGTDTVVNNSQDWRARNLFLYGTATF
jgi:hypothetical protein